MGLGSILGAIGGAIAAPFTGGASLIPSILGGAGQVAGAISGGRSAGRQAEYQQALSDYKTQQDAYANQADIDLAQKKFAMTAPQTRASQVALADILANLQPIKMSIPGIGPYEMSGGFNAGLLTDRARDAAREFGAQANTALFDKSDTKFVGVDNPEDLAASAKFDADTARAERMQAQAGRGAFFKQRADRATAALPSQRPTIRTGAPSLTLPGAPKPGKLDTFLNILGGAGSLASAVMPTGGVARQPTGITPGSTSLGPGVTFR